MDTQGGPAAIFLDSIDWSQPWLQPYRAVAAPLLAASDWRAALNAQAAALGLRNHRGLPLHFVPQAELPAGVAYEAHISATGGVPTRDNLHDFFNGLMWLAYPALKVALNALQAAEIARAGDARTAPRGRVRDAATIFDENAALVLVRDASLAAALRGHRWQELFVERRQAFGRDCDILLFGHALLEKLVAPYKAITAHAWVIEVDDAFFALAPQEKRAWAGAAVASRIAGGLATADFTPLPVAGIPGWWEGQDDAFYADTGVFRPRREKTGADPA
ncbi:MAG: DUF3025 domain-containing protein [Noviherbaspirillum sp.]